MDDKRAWEVYEQDYERCPYCETSYYEYDTGYEEFSCTLWDETNCVGGSILLGCPMACKYKIEEGDDDEN